MGFVVRTNFAGTVELVDEIRTLGECLSAVSKKLNLDIYSDKEGVIKGDFLVYLNGKEYITLPDGLQTEISDSDTVDVHMVMLVGG